MRRIAIPAAFLLLFGLAACGDDKPAKSSSSDVDAGLGGDNSGNAGGGGGGGDKVPTCPFTAATISDLVGQKLVDEGPCFWGDGNGVASVTITMASKTAGSATYDYEHTTSKQTYTTVTDVDKGDHAFIAVKDIEGHAVVISDAGTFTVTMSSFEWEAGQYEQALRKILDTVAS